ncbi:hypothetical protein K1T71_005798 [Dendrolimus kikuchii]|uniref:Uncharacterized protein n=1 Tax=Dendrolimus kikuchii TaxID=765133 RepID=A0ACC1D610_9NEOP|nr:hypothetical protein K1T71_005798 [Dendrolimus kikuchii]
MVGSNLCCYALVFLAVLCYVNSQICTERKRDYVTRTETRNISYYETYIGTCFVGSNGLGGHNCMKKRLNWSVKEVTITDYDYKTVQKCCKGYIQDDTSDSESIKCKPICRVHCENGFCDEPHVCSCHEGYYKKKIWYGSICEPECESNCTNGKCVSPNTCECNHGYALLNGTCKPVCSDSCINGECKAPENCECLPGYRKSNSSVCEPYCSTGCEHGECVAPETCRCDPGWIKANNTLNVETCMPVCNESCNNQSCASPETCVCKPGYVKTGRNQCNFYCSNCVYGKCVGIEKCACFPPKKLNKDGTDCVLPGIFGPAVTTKTLTDIITTESIVVKGTDSLYRNNTSSNTEEQLSGDRNWLYILLGTVIVLLVVISTVMLIIFKNTILRYCKGNENVDEDCPNYNVPESRLNVTYSNIKKADD